MTSKVIRYYASDAKELLTHKFKTPMDKHNTRNDWKWSNHDSYTTNTH